MIDNCRAPGSHGPNHDHATSAGLALHLGLIAEEPKIVARRAGLPAAEVEERLLSAPGRDYPRQHSCLVKG